MRYINRLFTYFFYLSAVLLLSYLGLIRFCLPLRKLTIKCCSVDRIEFTDKDTALQCPCHLRTVIWL